MTDSNDNAGLMIDSHGNSNVSNIKFSFNREMSSPDILGPPTRINNHLLLKAKSESMQIDNQYCGNDAGNNLKLKKKKKKFSWAKVQNAIRKTFHSKKKYNKVKKESNEEVFIKSSESNIISSAVYQNEEEVNIENAEKEMKKDSNKNSNSDIKSLEKGSCSCAKTSVPKATDQTNSDTSQTNHENQQNCNITNVNDNETSSNIVENVSALECKTKSQSKVSKSKDRSGLDEVVYHHNIDSKHKLHEAKDIIEHTSYIEKDTSEEFYKGICGNYYRYESDESSESVYSDLELYPNIEKSNRGRHRKNISMNYPSVSEGQSFISVESVSNDRSLFISKESPIEEDLKEYDDHSSNNNNDNPDKPVEEEGSVHSQLLQVDKKLTIHKEYSSDGDITDHDDEKSNIPNNVYNDYEIKKITDENDEKDVIVQNQNKKLYHQLIKNVKDVHKNKNEEFSDGPIINTGIQGSTVSNDISKSCKIEITNPKIKKDVSERVDITDIGEDKDSLKTASIEDCTSQLNLIEEEVEVDGYNGVGSNGVDIVIGKPEDECNHRFEEDLDCILEEKCDSNSNSDKGHLLVNSNNNNNNNEFNSKIYLQNNASVPEHLDVKAGVHENRKRHEKTNSYSCNDPHDYRYFQPLNGTANSTNSGFSTISGSMSYGSNLFGTYRSDNSDKFSDKVNKYYSLRNDSKNNSKSNSLKIRNSSRDIFASFKKTETRHRLDKSLNGSISKRSKKPMNIQFMAKYLKEDSNETGEEEEPVADADISSRLTAKEFAKLVGINILYDDDEKEEMANLKKEGVNKPSPNSHQPIDLSMFVPPNPTELATLHQSMTKPIPSVSNENNDVELNKFKEDIGQRIKKSATNIFTPNGGLLSDDIEVPQKTRTAPTTRSKFEFIVHSSQPVHVTGDSSSVHCLTPGPSVAKSSSSKTTPLIQSAQFRTEKDVTVKTQSTVSAKGRTFEVSYTSNAEFPEKNRPSTLGSQGSKVRNSKTEPNIHNEYSKPISRNNSIDTNKNNNVKSNGNIRNTIPVVSIVHGGPSEEMCRCILEKANPVLKIEREARSIIDSPMTDVDIDNYTIERIKLGETQTRPIGHSSLHPVQTPSDGRKASPIITAAIPGALTSSSNASTETNTSDPKVITYNKPLLSNNTKVIYFKSKRNNYINLQSTNIDGNKHRQLHKRRFEVRTSSTDSKYNKSDSVQEENDENINEINNKEDISDSPEKRKSIFYSSTSPVIKNLRTFSFVSNHPSSSSSKSSLLSPSKPAFINTEHILSPFTPLSPDPIEEDNEYDDVESHHSVSSHTLISGNNNLSDFQSPTLQHFPSKPLLLSQSPLAHSKLQPQETSHTLIIPGNITNGEMKISSNSIVDIPQATPKSHIITASSSLATPSSTTSGNTHTVITMSAPNNNQTVITTTKTTTTNHTFITTKTTNVPISSLLIDTSNVNSTPMISSPNTTVAMSLENSIKNEMINTTNYKMSNIPNHNNNIHLSNNEVTNNNSNINFNSTVNNNFNINNNNLNSSTTNINIIKSTASSISERKCSSINEQGMKKITSDSDNTSFYKCSKNFSSYDVPSSSTPITTLKTKASSVTNSRLHDPFYKNNNNSNSSIDMNISYDLAQKSFDTSSSINRPLMISTPNSVKVSNVEVLHGLEIITHTSNDRISSSLNFNNSSSVISNASYTTSPTSEVSHTLFESPIPISASQSNKSGIPTSPSLTVMPTQQTGGCTLGRHPKSLYIPRSRIQTMKNTNTSSSNIPVSPILTTTEETKGRFQIEKSEERKINSISSFKGSGGNLSVTSSQPTDGIIHTQIKSNSYCNDESENDTPLYSINSMSSNLVTSDSAGRFSVNAFKNEIEHNYTPSPVVNCNGDKRYIIADNKLKLQSAFVTSCDNILKKTSISDYNKRFSISTQENVKCTSNNSINNIEKDVKENELQNNKTADSSNINIGSTSNDIINSNGDNSNSNYCSPKKKEIVKGRFTITRDS